MFNPNSIRSPRRAVSIAFLFNGSLIGVWASRIPAIKENMQLSSGTLGILLLLMAAGAITAFPIAGRLTDKYGTLAATRWSVSAYGPAIALIALAPNVTVLAIALILFGITLGAMEVAMNGWGAEVERQAQKPFMTAFHAMFSLGGGLGALSGVLAISVDMSVTVHFILFAACIAVPTIWFCMLPWDAPEKPQKTTHGEQAPALALPKGPLLFAGLLAGCTALGEGSITDWSALYLIEETGSLESTAVYGYAAFAVAMVVVRLMGDAFVARFGPVRVVQASGIAATFGGLLVISGYTIWLSILGFAFMGMGYATVFPQAMSRAANDPHTPSGVAIAAVATLGYGGILLGPVVIGAIAEVSNLRMGFLFVTVLAALIFVLAPVLRVKPQEEASELQDMPAAE
ncbi:MFS transporter [Polycladidibacter hongkongensis]|uniref:MFS transporter n=1 Tax=Polycladidibacter hongkongensis TaxID=1647556 RepID=UPI0008295707|nr:MFS transporter [Pseudovibrio hongkongensis]